ncbi:hypothetical protein P7C73_g3379, partial [Tremellales sp. Uapishka_1]
MSNSTTNYPAPPAHGTSAYAAGTEPAAGAETTHTTGTTADGTVAGDNVGQKIKSGWNVFHGAGESIRGNINSFVDNVGEEIAGRGGSAARPATASDGGARPEGVAASGNQEVKQGLSGL